MVQKIAFYLIDFAHVLFKMKNFLNPLFSDFKLQVIESIIEKHGSKRKSIIGIDFDYLILYV